MSPSPAPPFAELLPTFATVLEGRNRSPHTIDAYTRDVTQFAAWLADQRLPITSPLDVTRAQVEAFLGHLAGQGVAGVSRARKLAALREFFRHLEAAGHLTGSPITGIPTPGKARTLPTLLSKAEYTELLNRAATNPCHYALLTVLLQTGVRVSELCALRLGDVDLKLKTLRVRSGKGQRERVIELESHGLRALRRWLDARPQTPSEHLFLNRYGDGLSARGVRKLLSWYCAKVNVKAVGPHALRHTFATAKAERGVSPFLLQEWLGHQSLNTTRRYVTLSRRNAQKIQEDTSL